jgi:hypothetical protein
MAEYDQAYFERSGRYPYYLLADKRADVVEQSLAAVNTDPPRYLRWLGLDYQRLPLSEEVRQGFVERHELETRQTAGVGVEYAYDCTYVTVYAALAAGLRLRRPLSRLDAEAIVTGLGALGGGELQRVGEQNVASAVAALTREHGWDGAIDLIGASGSLDIQPSGDAPPQNEGRRYVSVAPPDGELYCIDAIDRAICDTGIVFPRSGGPPTRLGKGCACFGTR